MMQPCNLCSDWAQWRVRKAIRDDKNKITGWELFAMLCGAHKDEQTKITGSEQLTFDFIGAAPSL